MIKKWFNVLAAAAIALYLSNATPLIDTSYCTSIGGYFSKISKTCFKGKKYPKSFYESRTTCNQLSNDANWRGRLAIIPSRSLYDQLWTNLPASFLSARFIVALHGKTPGSGVLVELSWWDNGLKVANFTYSPTRVDRNNGKVCTSAYKSGQFLFRSESCGTEYYFLCELVPVETINDCTTGSPADCSEIKERDPNNATSGIYTIKLMDTGSCNGVFGTLTGTGCCVQVYCDMDTSGGGWTVRISYKFVMFDASIMVHSWQFFKVIQKRFNGSVSFYKKYADYQLGFGSIRGEFWAGNQFLHFFTSRKVYEAQIELYQSERNCSIFARYESFLVQNSASFYKLQLGRYIVGTAGKENCKKDIPGVSPKYGDAMPMHTGKKFSTYDSDQDNALEQCAVIYKGGWWYGRCHTANLNGEYHDGCANGSMAYAAQMSWYMARGHLYSFGRTEIKLRAANYRLKREPCDKLLCEDTYFDPCPFDCSWNEWGGWGDCVANQRTRSRTSNPKQGGAKGCQGSNTDTQGCGANGTYNAKTPQTEQKCSFCSPDDCGEIKEGDPNATSGVYTIRIGYGDSCNGLSGTLSGTVCCVQVYCDMETFGGGWTIIQKRFNGSVTFNRNYAEYQVEFGNLYGEFWAGNEFLHVFTNRKVYEAQIELYQDERNCSLFARYASFLVQNSNSFYTLQIGNYTGGTAGDAMALQHNGRKFSTYDSDNDSGYGHCAVEFKGGWWYGKCHQTNINGEYHNGCTSEYATHMTWSIARGQFYSFARTEIKLRPTSYKYGCELAVSRCNVFQVVVITNNTANKKHKSPYHNVVCPTETKI